LRLCGVGEGLEAPSWGSGDAEEEEEAESLI
jgi:hypothetical protein